MDTITTQISIEGGEVLDIVQLTVNNPNEDDDKDFGEHYLNDEPSRKPKGKKLKKMKSSYDR
jgi:hypothetical protein